jgi:serine/threonine protein kinase
MTAPALIADKELDRLLRALARNDNPSGPNAYPPRTEIGPYLLHEELGRGGMGVVHRARDRRLGRDVALKLVPPELVADPSQRALLEREARAASSIDHANVTAVVDVSQPGQVPYLAMELVRGRSLRSLLRDGALPERDALGIALQIARGLRAAHEAGVVHRDLKPENVVVDAEGVVKILDFGLAVVRDGGGAPAGLSLSRWGTRPYMAPEQHDCGAIDARADVYAFGVVLHELLTGQVPSGGDDFDPRALTTRPDAPLRRKSRPAQLLPLRSEAGALVRACLAQDPSRRPPNGRALERAVLALLEPRRSPLRIALALIAAAACLVVLPARGDLPAGASTPRPARIR